MDAEDRKLLQECRDISIRNETTINMLNQRLFGQTGNNGFVGRTESRLAELETSKAKGLGAIAVVTGAISLVWGFILHRVFKL